MASKQAPPMGCLPRVDGRVDDSTGQAARGTYGWVGRYLAPPNVKVYPVCRKSGGKGGVRN